MSKLFYKAMIEDVQNDRCTDAEIEALLDVFENVTKKTATTLARKAHFNLSDFFNSKKRGIHNFILTLERREINGQEQWWGNFEYGNKKLKVIATLERD